MGTVSRLERKSLQQCRSCGSNFSKNKVQCPSCGVMQFEEHELDPTNNGTCDLEDVDEASIAFIESGPWDPCFGHRFDDDGKLQVGIPVDGVTLIGGVPGAGKSTLALHLADSLAFKLKRPVVLFVFEESKGQVKARAKRLKLKCLGLRLLKIVPMGSIVDLDRIMTELNPCAIVGDSLQKMCPDEKDAVEFCEKLKTHCSDRLMPALLINHVNKDEELAGLQALQHAVDTTLLFTVYEDEVRELRTIKNRYGASGIRVLFDMTQEGLVLRNPDDDEEDEDE